MNRDDLVIVPTLSDYNCSSSSPKLTSYNNVDFEKLASIQIQNILLVDFDSASPSVLRNIINLKSRKSEIIGISNNLSPAQAIRKKGSPQHISINFLQKTIAGEVFLLTI